MTIGDDFISAPGSIILAHDASLVNKYGVYRLEPTNIGNRVFLGANATILPGVKIGDDVIIGPAGSCGTAENRMQGKEDMECKDWYFCTRKINKDVILEKVLKK